MKWERLSQPHHRRDIRERQFGGGERMRPLISRASVEKTLRMHALNCLKLSYKPKTNEFRFKGLVIYADHGEAKIGNTVILKKAKGKIIMTSWLVGNPEEFQVLQEFNKVFNVVPDVAVQAPEGLQAAGSALNAIEKELGRTQDLLKLNPKSKNLQHQKKILLKEKRSLLLAKKSLGDSFFKTKPKNDLWLRFHGIN